MENSTLFQLLSTFSQEEIKNFDLFLNSPYHNSQEIFVKLFNVLKPYLIKQTIPTKEAVFQDLITDTDYDVNKLSDVKSKEYRLLGNYVSRLSTLAEDFLVTEANKLKESERNQTLLKILNERQLDKQFKSTYKKIQKHREKDLFDVETYFETFQEGHILHEFYQKTYEKNDLIFNNFQSTIHDFETYVLLKKLSFLLEIIAFEAVYKTKIHSVFMESIELLIKQKPYSENLLVQIYYQAYVMYKNANSDKAYFKLKEMVFAAQKQLTKRVLKELLSCLVNYSNRQVNQDRRSFMKESLEIYDVMAENNLLFRGDFPFNILNDYRNIVSIACRSGNLDWAKDFIEKNKSKMSEYAEACYNFGLGIYYFYSKDFDKATAHFKLTDDVEDVNIFYEINRRYLYIRALYESNMPQDKAMGIFDVNRDWFKRQGKSVSEKKQTEGYFNGTALLIQMYRLKYEKKRNTKVKNQRELDKIIKNFETKSAIMSKEWFEEKIEELK